MKLVPNDDELAHLLSDYNAMRTSGIISEGALGFDTLIEKIRVLEAEANALAQPPEHEAPENEATPEANLSCAAQSSRFSNQRRAATLADWREPAT